MSNTSTTGGFTIVELMVTLAVAAVLMGMAIPAFNAFVEQRRMTSDINDFVVAVNYTRSEAVRSGRAATLQSLGGNAANEWGQGYCVVVGNPGNCANALRRFAALDSGTLNAVGNLNGVFALTFNGRGMPNPALGGDSAVQLCRPDESPGRVANIIATGRTDVEELPCP